MAAPHRPSSSTSDAPPDAAAAQTVVLLCTYNEAANLPSLFSQLAEYLPAADVLVVDDNSPDGTADVVRQWASDAKERVASDSAARDSGPSDSVAGEYATDGVLAASIRGDGARSIHLLSRATKQGLGTATRDGLQWCLARDYDFVINMDADLSHDPAAAPRLLAACSDAQLAADVAVGSRYIAGGGFAGLAWHRRCISRLLNGYATRMLGLPIHDCSGSFRCYRTTALRRLDFQRLTCRGYGFLEEILVALFRQGASLTEVPIQFRTRARGSSKLGLGDALGAISVIHRLALRR